MPFEELDHTADYMYRCTGSTIDELFTSASMAIFSLMFDVRDDDSIEIGIRLKAGDYETLLYELLSEIIYLSEVENMVFSGIDIDIHDHSLDAIARGGKFMKEKHAGGTEIKGISRYDMNIENTGGRYCVDVIFDV